MDAIIHTDINDSIVASVSQFIPNVNDNKIPKAVFDRTLTTTTIGELFRKNENGEYINIDTTDNRNTTDKKYRIPIHQRHNKWNGDDKKGLIDSIWKNYN